jgi:hypothetical protein
MRCNIFFFSQINQLWGGHIYKLQMSPFVSHKHLQKETGRMEEHTETVSAFWELKKLSPGRERRMLGPITGHVVSGLISSLRTGSVFSS